MRRLAVGALAAMLAACASAPGPAPAPAAIAGDPAWPVSVDAYRTTSGAIYLGNLDARIEELARLHEERGRPEHATALAASRYHRYRIVGRFEDAEAALRLLDAAVGAEPDVAAHRTTRAVVLAGLHRFDDALADLAHAERHGATARETHGARREILLAKGDYAALRGEFEQSSELVQDFLELAHRADLRLQQGDLAGAEFRYRAAQAEYRDVNPFPLAWLHVQQGIAYLRHERLEDARRFFAAAHARMPQYYLATEHLAETEGALGNVDAARALYDEVIGQTGNPEFVAALSLLEADDGNETRAAELQAKADAGYQDLLARYPAAFTQHAAEYFMETGRPERAWELARANIELRQDIGSWILLSETSSAAGKQEGACDARAKALETGLRPPEIAALQAPSMKCVP